VWVWGWFLVRLWGGGGVGGGFGGFFVSGVGGGNLGFVVGGCALERGGGSWFLLVP